MNKEEIYLPVAERVWVEVGKKPKAYSHKKVAGWRSTPFGGRVLVIDAETTIDRFQAMKFGSFRIYIKGRLALEGLILGECLTHIEKDILQAYSKQEKLRIMDVSEFIDKYFYPEVYRLGAVCLGFNLPFDLSRLALKCVAGRMHWKDGFSLTLSSNPCLPRLRIQSINSKASFIEFARPFKINKQEGAGRSHFKGHFLDLRTLGWALKNQSLTLAAACDLFGVENKKLEVEEHGIVSTEYIDYNRRDVLATWEVYLKMMEEYKKHPIDLLPTKAFSPASIGKAYLKAMGIQSLNDRQGDFSEEILGYGMASYYGGRAEVHARKISVPITYVDVLSMYPSVFILQNLWKWVIAKRLEVEECTEAITGLLNTLTLNDLMKAQTWLQLPALVKIKPVADILPVRSRYVEGGDFQIGHNGFTSFKSSWYTLADVVGSKLLTGKTPQIQRAVRIIPVGIQDGLKPIKLGGEVFVDPAHDDFFKLVIEKRKSVQGEMKKAKDPLERAQLESLQYFLKILANSTSYGIFAEFNRKEYKEPCSVKVHGTELFESSTDVVEEPGPFANPLIATMITGAARLILSIIESMAMEHGATYAFCDTDSMAIIGEDPSIALEIVDRFNSLCPYNFGGSLLKIEDENYLEETREPETLYCYGISAKRYVLYNLVDGKPVIRKFSEHGLGHLLPPSGKGQEWIKEVWNHILCKHHGIEVKEPHWLDQPAIGRLTVTRPQLLKPNKSLRPFNFMLVAFPDEQAWFMGLCRKHNEERYGCPSPKVICKYRKECTLSRNVRPVAPYEKEPSKWSRLPWVDLSTGQPLKLDFGKEPSNLIGRVHVKTYRSVLAEYEYHPEAKAAGPDGTQCDRNTIGMLSRLHVVADRKVFIGKESNRLEEVDVLGLDDETYTIYRENWERLLPDLKKFTAAELARETGLSMRSIKRLRNERVVPHPRNEAVIREAVVKLAVK